MDFIQLRGVSKRFGKQRVLDNIDLNVPEGSIYGIIGLNSSGKTTLLKTMVGFYTADSGVIYYHGRKLHDFLPILKHTFGFATQENIFYPKLTVKENLSYFGNLYGLPKQQIAINAHNTLSLLELRDSQYKLAQHLSGGMKRRLNMACSIIHNPKVLFLDEPTEDLSPVIRQDFLRLIRKINQLGTTIILTSHVLDDVETICDYIAIIHHGRIVQTGTFSELLQRYGRTKEIHLTTVSRNYDPIITNLNIHDYTIKNNTLIITTPKAEKTLQQILQLIENQEDTIVSVDIKKSTLREIFETITLAP